MNNEHQGIYCLSENINSESLNLKNINAVLYKATDWGNGATRFESYSNNSPLSYYWDGWEQKYPDAKVKLNWNPLDELRRLVVKAPDAKFKSTIALMIDINNFVDYYIFLNLVSAIDNTGKNTFLVKENNPSKISIIPWDIDGSWGLSWDGTRSGYRTILSNNLFDRLIETNTDQFKTKLKQRWSALRDNTFSVLELKNIFLDNFTLLSKSKIMDIENRKWGRSIDIQFEQNYLTDWLDNRVIFLDSYFDNL